jgi:hypothetical protein
MLELEDPIDAFHLPLSAQAFEEFQEFCHLINETRSTRSAHGEDLWSYKWGTHFSARKIYNLNFDHIEAPIFSSSIWESKCTPKIKSFFWLLANDRLNAKAYGKTLPSMTTASVSSATMTCWKLEITFSGIVASVNDVGNL